MSNNHNTSWSIKIRMNEKEIPFNIDTGAEITAISETAYKQMRWINLSTPVKTLYGTSQKPLMVIVQFTGHLSYKSKTTHQPIFVVKRLRTNLLELPAIQALEVASRLEVMSTGPGDKDSAMKRYPSLFTGLGHLGEDHEIQLKAILSHIICSPQGMCLFPRFKLSSIVWSLLE